MMIRPATFLLLTFNHERYVRQAIQAALAQDYHPLQIIISDDASTDKTGDIIVEEVRRYDGRHEIYVNRNTRRLRSVEHLTHVISMIRGDLVVMAHGDDISKPQRTRTVVSAWQEQSVSMVSSNAQFIDKRGRRYKLTCESSVSRRIPAQQFIKQNWIYEMLGATLAFEPEVVTKFAPLTAKLLATGLDHVLPLRAAMLKGFFYVDEPLVLYRRHGTNMSNFTADRTTSTLAYDETALANGMADRVRVLDDLLVLQAERPGNVELKELQTQLEARLLSDLRRWSRLRAELRATAQLPTWISEEAMMSRTMRADFWSWYGMDGFYAKVKRRLRRILVCRSDSRAH